MNQITKHEITHIWIDGKSLETLKQTAITILLAIWRAKFQL